MSTHNICFCGEIRKIFTGYPPLSRPMFNRCILDSQDCFFMQTIQAMSRLVCVFVGHTSEDMFSHVVTHMNIIYHKNLCNYSIQG